MYYLEDKSQKEIAAEVGLSRPQISRILSSAREDGIVQINIQNPYSEEFQVEHQLEEKFSVSNAIVINSPTTIREEIVRSLATSVTHILEEILHDGDSIGVLGGETMAMLSQNIGPIRRKSLQICPLSGGIGPEGSIRQSNHIAKVFGERLKCRYFQFYAPACVASPASRNIFLKEPDISDLLERARRVSVAVVSIGQISESTVVRYFPNINKDDILSLADQGAVAVLGQSFFCKDGSIIKSHLYQRMIGLSASEFFRIPHVIAVAFGQEKEEAIAAILKSGCIDTLVTDLPTGRGILKYA